MSVMARESNYTFWSHQLEGYLNPKKHPKQSEITKEHMNKAVGLIQFTKDAVGELNKYYRKKKKPEITKLQLAKLTPIKQLDYVKDYILVWKEVNKLITKTLTLSDIYTVVFAPAQMGKPENATIYNKEEHPVAYKKNKSLDVNKDDKISMKELAKEAYEAFEEGQRSRIGIGEKRNLSQVLAEKIIKEKRVTFSSIHFHKLLNDKANADDNIKDVAEGKKSQLSNYKKAKAHRDEPGNSGEVEVASELLYLIYMLSKKYTFNISEITGGSHSGDSKHYFGRAIDINVVNGQDIGDGVGKNAVSKIPDKLILEFAKEAKKHGATKVLNKFTRAKQKDHHNHFHIQV